MNAAARRNRKARKGYAPVALGYCRVSTSEQAKNGASMAAQLADLQAKADSEGWTFLPFTDPGVSGGSLKRPGIQQAMAMLADGRADILMATSLDRISRNAHNWTALVELGKANDWKLVTLAEQIDTSTDDGEFRALLYVAFAQQERARIGKRIKRGLTQKRAEGVHTGRHSTLPRELVEHARTLAAQGMGETAIASALTREGTWTTASGSTVWTRPAVRSLLRVTPADELPPKKPRPDTAP